MAGAANSTAKLTDGMRLVFFIEDIKYLIMTVSHRKNHGAPHEDSTFRGDNLMVYLDGKLLEANVDVRTDIMQEFWDWVYKFKPGEVLHKPEGHELRLCTRDPEDNVKRKLKTRVDRVALWTTSWLADMPEPELRSI
eukprot:gnl/TRDRNA2_/TRDRNA2_78360_c2_seq1.p1 gnl/TRDRNA2_/TRDRNA2_78360_c2~~gnl/TRDRNA2_/TRDRNA2_78360_c2_seq1.p1  ORF type:complete len:148 (-),score=18.52 gnl/TRDRNA2_/TRDRNA2_78360_c2_seq1:17-427(-)